MLFEVITNSVIQRRDALVGTEPASMMWRSFSIIAATNLSNTARAIRFWSESFGEISTHSIFFRAIISMRHLRANAD